jgi:hypothetical protein
VRTYRLILVAFLDSEIGSQRFVVNYPRHGQDAATVGQGADDEPRGVLYRNAVLWASPST